METIEQIWVLEISVRDALKAHHIINDIPRVFRNENMEFVASDTASIFSEELAEEIECRLNQCGIEFTITELK